jgi:hypothetical protein
MRGSWPFARARPPFVGLASLVAVLIAAAYVPFAAGGSAQAFAVVTGFTKGSSEVVYGKVSPPVPATVQIKAFKGAAMIASVRTASDGTYRKVLHVPRGVYLFTVKVAGRKASVSHQLKPGMRLRVSARISDTGRFIFLPFFHY